MRYDSVRVFIYKTVRYGHIQQFNLVKIEELAFSNETKQLKVKRIKGFI